MPVTPGDRVKDRGQRLFVAIDAGPDLAAAVNRAVARTRPLAERAAWAGTGAPHITLVFLGNVEEERVPSLRATLREAAGRHPFLTLRVHGAGFFGRPTHPATLWAGIDGDREPLAALVADLRSVLAPLGFKPEDRPFHPHLTLARARGPRGDPALAQCAAALRDHDFGIIRAKRIILYRSELHPSGARHHVVEEFALGGR